MRLWEAENNRNTTQEELFRAMLTAAYPDVNLVVAGHHIFYRREGETQHDEIPSADALIFSHNIAARIWGPAYREVLMQLAAEPVETRDALLHKLFHGRK